MVEHVGSSGQVACPGLVDKYLASQGILKTGMGCNEKDNWSYTVVSKCSGTLGLWLSPGVSVKSAQVELIGKNGKVGVQNAGTKTVDLVEGGLFKLELAGESRVVFQLENQAV